mgnify:CR=1 FL=1
MSRVSVAARAAFDAVVSLVGSTAFRHRMIVLAVPVAVEVVTRAQETFTGANPGTEFSIAADTAALFVANWLRGVAERP